MKTTLVKTDSSNNRRKILSLNEEDMKAFILLFKNMEELKDYFSSNDEECSFSLISNNNEDYSLNKFYFSDDLYLDLLEDRSLVSKLLDKCPDIFQGSLGKRMEVSLNEEVPNSIHERNVKALINDLEKGGLKAHSVEVASVLMEKEMEEKSESKTLKLSINNK